MENKFKYSNSNKRYYTLDYYYKNKYGCKISKVSLNLGLTCPNKDGSKGVGGCVYCSKMGSGEYAGSINKPLKEQFEEVKNIMLHKWPESKFIAYFQANTNTYGPIDKLVTSWEEVLTYDNVVGINISTRPDSISKDCYEELDKLNRKTDLVVELGLQTIHDNTSKLINRCHTLKEFDDCLEELNKRNIKVLVHIINGLPYETPSMMLDTIRHINSLDIQGVKIHMLHIVRNTDLARLYEANPFHVLTRDEYVNIVCDQLELLRPEIVINRITGDPKKEDLVDPDWLLKKFCVLNEIDKELVRRNSYQGRLIEKND